MVVVIVHSTRYTISINSKTSKIFGFVCFICSVENEALVVKL